MLKTCLRGIEYIIQFLYILRSLVVKLRGEGGGQRNVQNTKKLPFFRTGFLFSDRWQYSESLVGDLGGASLIITRGLTYRHYARVFQGFTQDYKNSLSRSHVVTIGGEFLLFFGSLQHIFRPSDLCNLIALSYIIPIFDCCRVRFSMETNRDSPSHRCNNSTVSSASVYLTQDTPSELLRNVS
jgi:hypothetical protein